MFDSHCHLADIEAAPTVWEQSLQRGVASLLCCGYDQPSNQRVLALRQVIPALPIALGLHPWFANQGVEAVVAQIANVKPTAIGECGLDGSSRRGILPVELQVRIFEQQLRLASDLDLPVTVHAVRALGQVVKVLARYPNVRGAIHAFGGPLDAIRPLLSRGWKLGIGGAITWPQARKLHRVAQAVPLECVLLETDCPSVGIEMVSAVDVRPYHLGHVAVCLGRLKGVSAETVIAKTTANARELFGV